LVPIPAAAAVVLVRGLFALILSLGAAGAHDSRAHAALTQGAAFHAAMILENGRGAPDPSVAVTDSVVAQAPPERHRSFRDLKPARDMLHGLQVTGRDAMAVLRGPFHMDRSDGVWTLAALAVTGASYAYDQEILAAFHRNREDATYDALLEPGRRLEKLGLIGTTAPCYAAGLGIGYILRNEPLTQISSELLESHLITGVLRQVMERAVGRTRPDDGKGPRNYEFNDGDSFPSGHASVVFEVATVASHHTRSNVLRALYYALATSLALERADSNSHWPSDIVAGAIIGTVVSRAIVRRHADAGK